jgi:hypothetical protein
LEQQIAALRTVQRQAIHNINSMAIQLDGMEAQRKALLDTPPPTEDTTDDDS